MGVVKLGMLRDKVISSMGRPLSSLDDGDQFKDFTVHYAPDGRVKEIIIVSPQYKTEDGLSVRSSLSSLRTDYRKAKKSCYSDSGASATTTGEIIDAVDQGIALDRQIFRGRQVEVVTTLSVHIAGVPASVFGEFRKCRN